MGAFGPSGSDSRESEVAEPDPWRSDPLEVTPGPPCPDGCRPDPYSSHSFLAEAGTGGGVVGTSSWSPFLLHHSSRSAFMRPASAPVRIDIAALPQRMKGSCAVPVERRAARASRASWPGSSPSSS